MRSKLGVLPYVVLLLPFDIAIVVGILAVHLFFFVPLWFKKHKEHRDTNTQRPNPTAAIVIVNWDGKHFLAECLPSVIEAVKHSGGNHEILVVDNGSTDGSVEFIREKFPQIEILPLDRNYGFGAGNNRGAEHARTEVIVFLNNDMVVDCGFLPP